MNDLISRKEAIETINSLTVSVSGVDVFPPEGKKSVIETLDLLPGVPLHNKWISVKDRFPGDLVDVLVWFEYFRFGSYNCLYKTIGVGSVYNGKWSFINGSSGWQQLKVIAWMPLPEPPKER